MPGELHHEIRALVGAVEVGDALLGEHRGLALSWLDSTDDIFRRAKPATPSPHLVSYVLLVDRDADAVLLVDHRLSGLWLPAGGHVEPDEHPMATAQREALEELAIRPTFDSVMGERPFFLTWTQTRDVPSRRHIDVSLWFAFEGRVGQPLSADPGEFHGVRWWRRPEIEALGEDRTDPQLLRALSALNLGAAPR